MKDKNQPLLPWYINNTLTEAESHNIVVWLQDSPEAHAHCDSVQQISRVIAAQETVAPSIRVRSEIIAGIQQPVAKRKALVRWIWGIPLTVLFFVLLWLVIQPGNQLQWRTAGYEAAVFRIYRAKQGTTDFELLDEIQASPEQNIYQYADPVVLPGQNYHYVVEVTDQFGNSSSNQIAVNDSALVFAAQFAILLTSFMLTFGIITITQVITLPKLSLSAVY